MSVAGGAAGDPAVFYCQPRRGQTGKRERGGDAGRRNRVSGTAGTSLLAPFRVRSFRFQWPADLATSWAFEMETLILGWFVLVETGSVVLLTAFGSLQFFGALIAPMFGVIGDRIGFRNLLCLMRASYAMLALVLTAFAFAGTLGAVHVFVIATICGLVRPSDLVMRNALIGQTMPADQLMGAMGVSRTTSDSARIAGSLAGAGLVATFGMGPAYVAITLFYLLSLGLTLGVAGKRTGLATARVSPWRDLAEGIGYVWTTPRLLAAMWLAFLVNLTAFPLSGGLLPFVAKDVYGMGQAGLGTLAASFAFGALLGSITVTARGAAIRPARVMIVSSLAWHSLLLVFAQSDHAATGIVILMLAGFMQSLCMIPLAVLLLRNAADRFRGRVMGVRMLAIYSMPIGLLAAGVLIGRIGFAATASIYCVTGLVFTLCIAVHWRAELWRRDAPANAR